MGELALRLAVNGLTARAEWHERTCYDRLPKVMYGGTAEKKDTAHAVSSYLPAT